MATVEQYRQWAANARDMASRLSDGPDRDALLRIARTHEEKARRAEEAAQTKNAAD